MLLELRKVEAMEELVFISKVSAAMSDETSKKSAGFNPMNINLKTL